MSLPRSGWSDRAQYIATLDEVRARLDDESPRPTRYPWPYFLAFALGLVVGALAAL